MKENIQILSKSIKILIEKNSAIHIIRVGLVYLVSIIGDDKILMDIYLTLLLSCGDELRRHALRNNDFTPKTDYFVYNDKSFKY